MEPLPLLIARHPVFMRQTGNSVMRRAKRLIRKQMGIFAAVIVAAGYLYTILTGNGIHPADMRKPDGLSPEILAVQKEGMAPHKYINVFVTRVVDGDTLEVTYKGESHRVRLLYIDTPESVKPGVPRQPYSKEASELTGKLVLEKPVKLVFEKGIRDRYGRLLAHVILEDGSHLNALLVRNGAARVTAVPPNDSLADWFYILQEKAIEEKVGFWSLPEKRRPFIQDENGEYIPQYKLKKKAS